MNEIILEASERAAGKFREVGSIPGTLYGDGIESSLPVKFDEKILNRLIASHGNSAKVWVNINNSKKYGFIKEVQRKHLTRALSHIDIQIVSRDHEIKIKVPITFLGDDVLRTKQLQLQVYKSEVTVTGKMAEMPEMVEVDVSEMKLGDSITIDNLGLNKLLKVENDDASFGTIINLRVVAAEEPEAVVEAVAAPVAAPAPAKK